MMGRSMNGMEWFEEKRKLRVLVYTYIYIDVKTPSGHNDLDR